jgi:amino acid transporter
MAAAVIVAIVFYTSIIAVVAYIHPWQSLLGHSFATAYAFEAAFGQRWIVQIIFLAALLSLLKVFNGNFLASSRLLFALGRRTLITPRFGQVHPVNQTPAPAVLAIGVATGAAAFLGEAILIPITEVGSMASACGWFAACMAFVYMKPLLWQRAIALCGAIVAALLVTMKLAPGIPGHFTPYEWLALGGWCVLGLVLRLAVRR